MNTVSKLLELALKFIFPNVCVVCEKPLRAGIICTTCRPYWYCHPSSTHCERCFSALDEFSERRVHAAVCRLCTWEAAPFRAMRFCFSYDAVARNYLRAMKYKPSRKLAQYSGECMGMALPQLFSRCDWDVIVPVPSSRATLSLRGFFHCLTMARSLRNVVLKQRAMPGCTPTVRSALFFATERPAQATLPHRKRFKNLSGSMGCHACAISGKKVLLVEDVITTGTTVITAACTLLHAGAQCVDIVALARSPRWGEFRGKSSRVVSAYNYGE